MDEKFIVEEIYDYLRNINSDGKGLILDGLVRGMLLGMAIAEKKLPAMPEQPNPQEMPKKEQPHFPTGETVYGP